MTVSTEIIKQPQTILFKIGAVSRITNIPVDTLRIWERRYQVVVPVRSDNADRLYHQKDINRLTLLKMLVDRGHSIGSIVAFTNDQLIERLEVHDQNNIVRRMPPSDKMIRVTVIGSVLTLQLEHTCLHDPSFCFFGLYRHSDDFDARHENGATDILVLEYPTIQEDQIQDIRELFNRSEAKKLILVYGFTNSAARRLLQETNYVFIHAPITVEHLYAEIKNIIEQGNFYQNGSDSLVLDDKAPKRTYSNKHLIYLSSASSTIQCECPQHLSTMILKLVQFEVYSDECENRNKKDAELHQLLGNMTGHARAIMEQALAKVVEAEGLKLP